MLTWVFKGFKTSKILRFLGCKVDPIIANHLQSPPITHQSPRKYVANHLPITSEIPLGIYWHDIQTRGNCLFLCSLMMHPFAKLAVDVWWLSFILPPSSLSLRAPSLFPYRFRVCSVFSLCLVFSLLYFFHRWQRFSWVCWCRQCFHVVPGNLGRCTPYWV